MVTVLVIGAWLYVFYITVTRWREPFLRTNLRKLAIIGVLLLGIVAIVANAWVAITE